MKKIIICCLLALSSFAYPLQLKAEGEKPEVVSDYVYMYDRETGQVIWDKGAHDKMYPASLTKLMTALVAIENIPNLDQQMLIDETVMFGLKEAGASRAGFNVGDIVTMQDLIFGTLLPSGAECTQALAYEVSGSVQGYVDLMNKKAQEIGMNNTHFSNTTGLHDDNHYSTLYDISLLLDYALQNQFFYDVFTSSTYQAGTSFNYPTQGLKMESTAYKFINNPTSNQPYKIEIEGFMGSKTGYTVEARYCLASLAQFNGMDLILITAHAWVDRKTPSHFLDADVIYNTYRENFERATVFNAGDTLKESVMKYKFFDKTIKWEIVGDLEWNMPIDAKNAVVEVRVPEVIDDNIAQGEVVGELIITSFGEEVYRMDIVSPQDYKQNIILLLMGNAGDWMMDNLLITLLGGFMVSGGICVLVLNKRNRRPRRI